jgi:hypothetical protein
MTSRRMQDDERTLVSTGLTVPSWISQDLTFYDAAAICQGGCESGAYMPGVTYWQALATMALHGDEVLDYIVDFLGELPPIRSDSSWGQIAVVYLSYAVELFASRAEDNYDPECDDGEAVA